MFHVWVQGQVVLLAHFFLKFGVFYNVDVFLFLESVVFVRQKVLRQLFRLSLIPLPEQSPYNSPNLTQPGSLLFFSEAFAHYCLQSFITLDKPKVAFPDPLDDLEFLVVGRKVTEKHQDHNRQTEDVSSVVVFLRTDLFR